MSKAFIANGLGSQSSLRGSIPAPHKEKKWNEEGFMANEDRTQKDSEIHTWTLVVTIYLVQEQIQSRLTYIT